MNSTKNQQIFQLQEGVYVSSTAASKHLFFESKYISVRTKENRILSVQQIRQLPEVDENYVHAKEWNIRKKNINRFIKYLRKKNKKLRILDIGCGNGFFSNLMSLGNEVVAVDVNLTELKQASAAFSNSTITWYYADILNETLPEEKFDLITFCASFQYFNDPALILKKCQGLLNPGGEIHIIDSPFYTQQNLTQAKLNSARYYENLNENEMKEFYHHHNIAFLSDFSYRLMYRPNHFLLKWFHLKDSPFPWIKLQF